MYNFFTSINMQYFCNNKKYRLAPKRANRYSKNTQTHR